MPAYNAGKTLEATLAEIPDFYRKNVLVVDDSSTDDTVSVAKRLGLSVIVHDANRGYGANQKTCYAAALAGGADVVVMVHPDNQYDPRLCGVMSELVQLGVCDMVLGNRIRTRREALDGGMPLWKYLINRVSTLFENFVLGQSIGDFHSGYRAYSRELLERIPFHENSDDFAFDQEMLVQAVAFGFKLGDIPVPVRYGDDASSIGFRRSVVYGLGGLRAIFSYWLAKAGLRKDSRFTGMAS